MSLNGIGIGVGYLTSELVEAPPTSGSARYNYTTPPTGTTPVAGELQHSDAVLGRFNVSYIDADGGSHNYELLKIGDTITINGQVYIVQSPVQDFGAYGSIPIDPTIQQPDGLYVVAVSIP